MLPVDEKEFDVVPFVYGELSLFVHHSHPLAQREKVEMKELQNETFILFKHPYIHDLIIQECLRAGFRPEIAYEISEWGFISGMIVENLGISIFPKPVVEKVDQDLIKAIPILIQASLGIWELFQKRRNMLRLQFVNLSSILQLTCLPYHE